MVMLIKKAEFFKKEKLDSSAFFSVTLKLFIFQEGTFQARKVKKHSEKVSFISGNGTF